MRVVGAIVVILSALIASAQVEIRAQGATCRSLAPRGKVWADCCAQSYARRSSETMSRGGRMQEIESCVRNGGKLS
jgi:hypothetical protein